MPKDAEVIAYIECRNERLPGLVDLARRVDHFVGATPPPEGYGLAEAFSAILNGGTVEDIRAGLGLLDGWSFEPKGGWIHDRKERRR